MMDEMDSVSHGKDASAIDMDIADGLGDDNGEMSTRADGKGKGRANGYGSSGHFSTGGASMKASLVRLFERLRRRDGASTAPNVPMELNPKPETTEQKTSFWRRLWAFVLRANPYAHIQREPTVVKDMPTMNNSPLQPYEYHELSEKWTPEAVDAIIPEALQVYNGLRLSQNEHIDVRKFTQGLGLMGYGDSKLPKYLFEAINIDGTGTISFMELVQFMLCVTRGSQEDRLAFGFRLFDTDRDNVISRMDVMRFVDAICNSLWGLTITAPELNRFVEGLYSRFEFDSTGHMSYEGYCKGCSDSEAFIRSFGLTELQSATPQRTLNRHGRLFVFGHEKWNLMLGVMLALQLSEEKMPPRPRAVEEALTPDEFTSEETYEINATFIKDKTFIVHYASEAFRDIRAWSGISLTRYLYSLGIKQVFSSLLLGDLTTYTGLGSEGKSGSFFFYSHDGKFIVKTISVAEKDTILRILPDYYEFLRRTRDTLLSRVYGLYQLRFRGQTFFFVVMSNIFCSPKAIHLRFDLKGSTVGRFTATSAEEIQRADVVYKDLDFLKSSRMLNIGEKRGNLLMAQLRKDSEFLSSHGIIDYSFLIGVHKTSGGFETDPEEWVIRHMDELVGLFQQLQEKTSDGYLDKLDFHDFGHFAYKNSSSSGLGSDPEVDKDNGLGRLAVMESQRTTTEGSLMIGEEIFFVALIDIFIAYEFRKQAEHMIKSAIHDSTKISVVPPALYRNRFLDFISDIIM